MWFWDHNARLQQGDPTSDVSDKPSCPRPPILADNHTTHATDTASSHPPHLSITRSLASLSHWEIGEISIAQRVKRFFVALSQWRGLWRLEGHAAPTTTPPQYTCLSGKYGKVVCADYGGEYLTVWGEHGARSCGGDAGVGRGGEGTDTLAHWNSRPHQSLPRLPVPASRPGVPRSEADCSPS